MNENMNEYNHLINMMTSAPKVPAPDGFTQNVMGRLPAGQKLSVWSLLWKPLAETRAISWDRFSRECSQGHNACSYFFITGLFFFIIGSMLFSSLFHIGHVSKAMNFILMQAVLVLTAAILLVGAGLIMAANMPDATRWAKRAIILFGVLIIANSMFINTTVKTTPGILLAATFGITGIVTAVILMKALERRAQGNSDIITGRLYNV